MCVEDTTVRKITENQQKEVRDELIPIERIYYRCEECGEEFEVHTNDYDPFDSAYREYRRRKGWVQPEEIKEFRESLGFTQKQFSDLLGIGIATLNRYENGALQSEATNRLISLCMNDPWILIKFAHNGQTSFSDEDLQQLFQNIERYLDGMPQLVSDAIDRYGSYEASLMSGGRVFDFNRFCEVAKILCHETKQFTTKLQKLFFYTDFKHYKEHNISITGMRYAHLPHGPVPDEYKTWLAALTDWMGILEPEKIEFDQYCGEVFEFKGEPNYNLFSLDELNTIRFVKEKFKNDSSSKIEEFSHKEKGYILTDQGQCISYEYAEDLQI
jgi:putative zinc finger/helix-turn-helix YgiT family protein